MDKDRDRPATPERDSEVAAVAAAVAALRRRVSADAPVDLAALTALAAAISRCGHGPAAADPALVNLLDELDLLLGALGREHTALFEQLRSLGRHRLAGCAYGSRSIGR